MFQQEVKPVSSDDALNLLFCFIIQVSAWKEILLKNSGYYSNSDFPNIEKIVLSFIRSLKYCWDMQDYSFQRLSQKQKKKKNDKHLHSDLGPMWTPFVLSTQPYMRVLNIAISNRAFLWP